MASVLVEEKNSVQEVSSIDSPIHANEGAVEKEEEAATEDPA